jgi:hypothetical protein
MKQLLYALPAIFLMSCSPKFIPVVMPPLPDNTFVVVLDKGEHLDNRNEMGSISAADITGLKQTARSHGANLVKITSYQKEITARIYKVDNPKLYETKFEWDSIRKLTWEDFKGRSTNSEEGDVAATTSCRFGLQANNTITNEFICYQSSVKPDQKTPSLLAHEQLHFDLCEVYTRRLRKQLPELKPEEIQDAFIRMHKLYKEQQDLYDTETNHGLEPQAQARWAHTINEELKTLSAYKKEK